MTPPPACGPKPILSTARRFPFGGRRPGPPRPAPDGAGPRLEKAPVAVHPLPHGLIFTHIFGWTRGVGAFSPNGAA